jgi:hypothetical protein
MNFSNWGVGRLAGAILLFIGLIFGGVGSIFLFDVKSYADKGVEAQGQVIENIPVRSSKGGTTYTPLVLFKTQSGQEVQFEDGVSSKPPAFDIGEKVNVLYMPDNPNEAIVADGMWLFPGIFVGIGGVLLTIAVVCFVVDFKNRGKAPEPNPFKDFDRNFKDFDRDIDAEFDEEHAFDVKVEVRELLRKKQKLEAIKYYKDAMDVSLQEAMKAVDDIDKEMKAEGVQ